MRLLVCTAVVTLSLLMVNAHAQEESALSCADFNPTPEAMERFPDLEGACEAVVERDGELYGRFRAVVRRANSRSVTLYLPVTDRTFTVQPDPETRVLMGKRKLRPRDLQRGDEIRIYLATRAFAKPDIEEMTFVTDSTAVITHPVVPEPALPTTASPLPTLGLAGLILLAAGFVLRRRRLMRGEL